MAARHRIEERMVQMREEPRAIISHGRGTFSSVHRSYSRAARRSRLAVVAFSLMVFLFLLWALPWVPLGMSADDYSLEVLLALILLGCSPAVTAVTLLTRGMAAQRREALIAWASIYDRATGLRNRDYFLERLALQCQLGREVAEYRVGVIIVAIEELQEDGKGSRPADDRLYRLIGMSMAGQMRPTDLIAPIGNTEMGVLVSAASPASVQLVAERVRRSLDQNLEEIAGQSASNLSIRMGVATLNHAQSEPEALLAAARSSMKLVRRGQAQTSAA
jgi:diguanylate cyclase (GGDEF)-like protein